MGAEVPGGIGVPNKRMPGGRKAAGKRGRKTRGLLPDGLRITGPDAGPLLPGLERALTWAGEPWSRKRARMPEPKGTLDTLVNGPEGLPPFDGDAWERVDLRHHEEQVRRLRGRIFQAVREGDWPKARSLQKLMLRSWSNVLVSVRQVTQRNTGRRTAGIDGLVALTSQARAEMAVRVHASIGSHRPSPVRRVYVPKASDKTKLRPLGIPVLIDRCHQARVKNALEPEWEARFEPRSYGFRPGRGCHDAIESLFNILHGKSARVWILDADLASAFDKISHGHLLSMLGGFPAKEMIAGWLKAGVFEAGKGFAPTGEGTPQGGIASPLLLNIALHGLEEAAGVRYRLTGAHAGELKGGSPALTRYADDLVVCCHSRQQAEQVKARLAGWLAPRGLAFNEAKTRIVHLNEGFDFLGFSLRRYPNGKLLIKPGTAAIKRFRKRLAGEFRRGTNAEAVLATIVPITRGLSAYYKAAVSSRTFSGLDAYLWKLTYKWACWTHPNKPKPWITGRYYRRFSKFRNDRWVFGNPDTGAHLPKLAWTPIVRHTLVKGGASPDDPSLAAYWASRRQKVKPPLDPSVARLLSRQDGRCSGCGENLLPHQPPQSPEDWTRWFLQVIKMAITADYLAVRGQPAAGNDTRTHLIHATCRRRLPPARRRAGGTVPGLRA
jgi:RNA-directed DNA polymerase